MEKTLERLILPLAGHLTGGSVLAPVRFSAPSQPIAQLRVMDSLLLPLVGKYHLPDALQATTDFLAFPSSGHHRSSSLSLSPVS